MPVAKVTGKAGSFKYNGVVASFTKWSAKADRQLADSTDSSNYDAGTDMIHKAQLPVSLQSEVAVEGNFDLNSTDATWLGSVYSGASAVPCILGINATVVFGHGNFDISDFEAETPVNEIVTFKATLKSNGLFTHGS